MIYSGLIYHGDSRGNLLALEEREKDWLLVSYAYSVLSLRYQRMDDVALYGLWNLLSEFLYFADTSKIMERECGPPLVAVINSDWSIIRYTVVLNVE